MSIYFFFFVIESLQSVKSIFFTHLQEAELAAVLLRRLIATEFDQVFLKLAPEIQNQAKSQILIRINQDINPNLKRKISDVAAELVRNCIGESLLDVRIKICVCREHIERNLVDLSNMFRAGFKHRAFTTL